MKHLNKIIIISIFTSSVVVSAWYSSDRIRTASASYSPLIMRNFWSAPMPSYPTAKEYPLSDKMSLANTRVKISWFRSTDEPLQIARYYSDIWKSKGYFVTEDITPFGGKVSSVDIKDNLQRQIVMEKKGKETTVFVSLIMGQLMKLSNIDPKSSNPVVPIYPGAEGLISFGSDDKLSQSSSISYVDRGTISDNISFYKKEMASRGYSLSTDTAKQLSNIPKKYKSMTMLIFTRGTEESSITISSIAGSQKTRVNITRVTGKGE